MKKAIKNTWDYRKISFAAVAIVIVAAFCTTSETNAASTIYNMDRLLGEPHPFAAPQPTLPKTKSVVKPGVTPHAKPAPLVRKNKIPKKDEDDLDLDDLGPSNNTVGKGDNDPIEPLNRAIFGFNEILVKYLIGPIAEGYNAALPNPIREAIRNFLSNLNGPVILANDLLQGELKRGYDTSARMIINSTAGALGFFDVAEKLGFAKHREDFGQTLAVWGIGEGFYLVLPVFGPSNPRDALGRFLIDPFFDPLGYYLRNTDREEIGYGLTGARGLTGYANIVDQINELRENSLDFYGALRSLYRQRRQSEIRNGGGDDLPDMDFGSTKP
jgi:phospholipid-binding lipoprotein MlaA